MTKPLTPDELESMVHVEIDKAIQFVPAEPTRPPLRPGYDEARAIRAEWIRQCGVAHDGFVIDAWHRGQIAGDFQALWASFVAEGYGVFEVGEDEGESGNRFPTAAELVQKLASIDPALKADWVRRRRAEAAAG